MVMAQGIEETILRKDIAAQTTGALSLMPDGFEEVPTRGQLADLLAYLKGE